MVHILVRPRQAGKTHDTLIWYLQAPKEHMIVTFSEQEAVRLRREAAAMVVGQETSFEDSIISVHSLPHHNRGRNGRIVRIDNADIVLQQLVGVQNYLDGVTWNG